MGNLYKDAEPCNYWHPSGPCGALPTRRYLNGWYCPAHTPAALQGRPEVVPRDPGLKPMAQNKVRAIDLGEVYRQNRRARIDRKRQG